MQPDAPAMRVENLAGAFATTVERAVEQALQERADLGETEAAALATLLNYADGRRQDTLRRALALSQPGAVRAVDRLVARGLVARERSGLDGREALVRLTPAGRDAARAALRAREDVLARALAPLDAAGRAHLEAALSTVLAGLTDGRDAARRICRLCDGGACGHPEQCPVTQAAGGPEG